MTDILIAALAVTLTAADGAIRGLGRQLAERDDDVILLIRTLSRSVDTLHRYGLLP